MTPWRMLASAGLLVTLMTSNDASAAGAQATPEARVRAFIADYFRVHRELAASKDPQDFDHWKELVDQLDRVHFVEGGGRELATVITGNATHRPDEEQIISHSRARGGVFVETRIPRGPRSTYFEYEMRQRSGDWRIVRIREYLGPADAPFMNEQEREVYLKPRTLPLRALPDSEAAFDGTALFQPGRSVTLNKEITSIEVRRVGTLNVTSGVLVVGDLGYDAMTLSPLGMRVPQGQYPVDLAIGFKRAAALRLLLSDRPVVKWHPADMQNGGHVVGVDAGNVSISDASALITVTARDKERAFESFADTKEQPMARILSLVHPNDVAISETGYGDGGYPVYWGLDLTGQPAALVVDYFVLTPVPEDE